MRDDEAAGLMKEAFVQWKGANANGCVPRVVVEIEHERRRRRRRRMSRKKTRLNSFISLGRSLHLMPLLRLNDEKKFVSLARWDLSVNYGHLVTHLTIDS